MRKARKSDFDPSFFMGIAHRGLHDDEIPENSLAAFQKAIDANVPFELDIHLTKDGHLVVFHDFDLERMTGKKGIIEKLTLEQIRNNYYLPNGERIPTLDEVFAINNEKVLMVIELKANQRFRALGQAALRAMKHVKNKKKYTFISFDPRALIFVRRAGYTTGLLLLKKRMDVSAFRRLFGYLDVETTLLDDPRIAAYRKKGGIVNTWTVHGEKMVGPAKGKCDTMTFEYVSPEIVKEALTK